MRGWVRVLRWGLLMALTVFFVWGAVLVGAAEVAPSRVWAALLRLLKEGLPDPSGLGVTDRILLYVRLPRVLLAFLSGAVLAGAGAVYQGVFRNPMADPYVLGISAGGALGTATAVFVLPGEWLPLSMMVGAFTGGAAALLLVYGIAGSVRSTAAETLLLSGISVSLFLSALLSLLLTFVRDRVGSLVFWMMGSFSTADWDKVGFALGVLVGEVLLVVPWVRDLDVLSMGDETAVGLGVRVVRVRLYLLLVVSLAASGVVALCGPVGFVGLVVPHMVRRLLGARHVRVFTGGLWLGGMVMVAADTLARVVLSPSELPVGVVTALVGVPFFVYLLRWRRG